MIIKQQTHSKLVVQLVCEERIGQLSEVELAEGAYTVYVLHVHVFRQVWNILAVEFVSGHNNNMEEAKNSFFGRSIP